MRAGLFSASLVLCWKRTLYGNTCTVTDLYFVSDFACRLLVPLLIWCCFSGVRTAFSYTGCPDLLLHPFLDSACFVPAPHPVWDCLPWGWLGEGDALVLSQHHIRSVKCLPMRKACTLRCMKPPKVGKEQRSLCCCRLIICQQRQLCTCAFPYRDVSALVGHVVPLHADCHHVQVSILPEASASAFLSAYFCAHEVMCTSGSHEHRCEALPLSILKWQPALADFLPLIAAIFCSGTWPAAQLLCWQLLNLILSDLMLQSLSSSTCPTHTQACIAVWIQPAFGI